MTNEKRLQANCLRCGWCGWSEETHICEFGEVMPAVQDMMRIAPEPDIGGTLTKILAKERREEKRLQALAKLQEDGERMAEDFALKQDGYACGNCNYAYGLTHIEAAFLAGFNKGAELERERVLDLVMEEADRINEPYLYMEDLKAIISELKGNKPATDKLSPEYLEQFKQAQADNPNLHLYFGDKK